MSRFSRWVGFIAIFIVACSGPSAGAQPPDFTGIWTAHAVCPVGAVEFSISLRGMEGSLAYGGLGDQKRYAASFPVKVTYFQSDLIVHVAGPNQGADFGSFQGVLLADGSIDNVRGLNVNGEPCALFTLSRDQTDLSASAPGFNIQGLSNEQLFRKLLLGRFAAINIPTDHPVFNSLYGSYLNAYARQCAADPKTRPGDFVEMTDLQCTQEGVTATYYRNGVYTESAPYCTRWEDVPSGLFADPKMWEAKEKLDAVLLGDTYRLMFEYRKMFEPGSVIDRVFKPGPQKIMAAILSGVRDMDAMLGMNDCDSPGLMRFQSNLRLYALNRPFGIRPDGSSGPPIPIPAPGTAFEDPNYLALLEDLIKGQARSWQINKYVLKSLTNPSVTSRDDLGRPLNVTADYKYGSLRGPETGIMTVTFLGGYPECLYFADRPKSCRPPEKQVVAKYVHGGYSLQNAPIIMPEEQRLAEEKRRKQQEAATQKRRDMRR